MPPPETLTVAAVSNDGRQVQLVGHGETGFGVSPKGTTLSQGQQFKGWVNPQGDYGPYVKVADKQNGTQAAQQGFAPQPPAAPVPPQSAQGRDPKDVSIERQVAAKCAAQVIAPHYPSIPDDQFQAEVKRVVGAFAFAISQDDSDLPF